MTREEMSQQDIIREGIAKDIYSDWAIGSVSWDKTLPTEKIPWLKTADKVMKGEDSQGVVIKAKCPDCGWSQFGEEAVGMTPCYSCDSTGYIIEPLIKEE